MIKLGMNIKKKCILLEKMKLKLTYEVHFRIHENTFIDDTKKLLYIRNKNNEW